MYCLDANIIISIFRGDKELKKMADSIGPGDVSFTAITLCELFKGAYKAKNREAALSLIYELMRDYRLFPLNAKSAEIFGADFNRLEQAGKQTQVLDLLTASIAKENGLVLVTRNKKHFENIPDLKVEEW